MDAMSGAAGVVLFLALLVFVIALVVAPLKLYSIHHEIRRTNELLQQQFNQLTTIAQNIYSQSNQLTNIAQNSYSQSESLRQLSKRTTPNEVGQP
jgi:uncharacterized protein YoxC